MAVYQYVAFGPDGCKHQGLVEGSSPREVRRSLRGRDLYVAVLAERAAEGRPRGWLKALAGTLVADRSLGLALSLRELSTLLGAGIPLERALEALAEQSEDAGVEAVLRDLRGRVLRGESLSDAAAAEPRYFPPVLRSMIAAGEASGELASVLRRASDALMLRREVKGKVSAALVYPAVLLAVSTGVVAFLLVYVVPRISAIYVQAGAQLPFATRVLLGVTDFFQGHGLALVASLVGVVLGLRYALRQEKVALPWDRVKLRLPFLGAVYRKRCVAEFARTLSGLLATGVPQVDALRLTAGAVGNRAVAAEVRDVAREVECGRDASGALRGGSVFPPTAAEMMAAGEESGELVELLEALAGDYERQVEVAAERACRALEPLVVVLAGGLVLFIVLSVLLPIARLSQVVQI